MSLAPIVIQTCERIIALEDDFKLDMEVYEVDHECGTAYCIAGRLAHLEGYPAQFVNKFDEFNYPQYAAHLCAEKVLHTNPLVNWLFAPCWPNDLEHAKARARYLLDTHSIPEDDRMVYAGERVFDTGNQGLYAQALEPYYEGPIPDYFA